MPEENVNTEVVTNDDNLNVDLDTTDDNLSKDATNEPENPTEEVPVELNMDESNGEILVDIIDYKVEIARVPEKFDDELQAELDTLCGHNFGKSFTEEQINRRKNLILLKNSIEFKHKANSIKDLFKDLSEYFRDVSVDMYFKSTYNNNEEKIKEEDI